MSGYRRLAVAARRFLQRHAFFILALGAGYLVARRAFFDPPSYGFGQIAALALIAAMLVFAAAGSLRPLFSPKAPRAGVKQQLEMGLTLVVAAYALLQMTAHAGVDLYPIIYLLMTFLVFFYQPSVGTTCLAFALAIEAGAYALGDRKPEALRAAVTHAVFMLLFSVLYYLLQWSEVRLRRIEHRADVERHIKEIEDKALGYRLISARKDGMASEISDEERADRLRISGVLVIKKALANQIRVAAHVLKARTVALFMLDPQGKNLQLLEAHSASEGLRSGDRIPAGEGFLGGVVNGKQPVTMAGIREGFKGITWYRTPEQVGAAAAVPVFEDVTGTGHLRGVLLADRPDEQGFTDEDMTFLGAMAADAMRTMEVEQVVLDMDREKNQKEKFYEASRRLGEALSLKDVLSATVDAARTVGDYDFVAVTLVVDDEKRKQKLAHVFGKSADAEKNEGLVFPEGPFLVSSVVKLGVPLPGKDFHEMEKQGVFPPQVKLKDVESIKVLPLSIQKRPLGTLVVGLEKKHRFGNEEMNMLLTVASLAAIAVENGKLYEKMEQMATTDGLTGLYNHRVFQEKLDEALARTQRSGKKLSMILMDIDHFKKVNDTHGHPVGDAVLKGVAKVLRDGARAVDTVARYGGEEFAVIMEETEQAGGKVKAERIREDVKKVVFASDQGRFTVAVSLGIATYPDEAKEKKELILRADEALYHSKRAGRDRSTSWGTMKA
ncbi:MAG: diguanylate cyclase [Deltaproteobacteria bacterium]|nr:diguanylate cyclase [Deltaproteobacteria bacterium]